MIRHNDAYYVGEWIEIMKCQTKMLEKIYTKEIICLSFSDLIYWMTS